MIFLEREKHSWERERERILGLKSTASSWWKAADCSSSPRSVKREWVRLLSSPLHHSPAHTKQRHWVIPDTTFFFITTNLETLFTNKVQLPSSTQHKPPNMQSKSTPQNPSTKQRTQKNSTIKKKKHSSRRNKYRSRNGGWQYISELVWASTSKLCISFQQVSPQPQI